MGPDSFVLYIANIVKLGNLFRGIATLVEEQSYNVSEQTITLRCEDLMSMDSDVNPRLHMFWGGSHSRYPLYVY